MTASDSPIPDTQLITALAHLDEGDTVLDPTEEIREAARLIRERAEAATPGPWRVCAEGSEGSRIAPASGDKREQTRFIAIANGRIQPEDGHNARHIASWHPLVALAVGDWLEVTARDVGTSTLAYHAALAVARAYLGTGATDA